MPRECIKQQPTLGHSAVGDVSLSSVHSRSVYGLYGPSPNIGIVAERLRCDLHKSFKTLNPPTVSGRQEENFKNPT